MTQTPKDGGPAFPTRVPPTMLRDAVGNIHQIPGSDYEIGGMSLRDWFAGQLLTNPALMDRAAMANEAGLAELFGRRTGIRREEVVAALAYVFADAMLKAREAKP